MKISSKILIFFLAGFLISAIFPAALPASAKSCGCLEGSTVGAATEVADKVECCTICGLGVCSGVESFRIQYDGDDDEICINNRPPLPPSNYAKRDCGSGCLSESTCEACLAESGCSWCRTSGQCIGSSDPCSGGSGARTSPGGSCAEAPSFTADYRAGLCDADGDCDGPRCTYYGCYCATDKHCFPKKGSDSECLFDNECLSNDCAGITERKCAASGVPARGDLHGDCSADSDCTVGRCRGGCRCVSVGSKNRCLPTEAAAEAATVLPQPTPPSPPVDLPTGAPPPKINLENPLGGSTGELSVPKIIGNIIKTILTIVGAMALGMFVYGGFTWLTSGGSSDKIKKGKDILMWATIGLIVIFSSYTLVDFLLKAFGL